MRPGLNSREPDESALPQAGARHRLLWTLAGTVLGIGLLYAATRKLDAAALIETLGRVQWPWSCAVLAATLLFCAIKTWRWALLLRFLPNLRFRDLHAVVYVGLAANFLVAHVGEFLRAATIARVHGVAVSGVFASVVIERVLDFIALLVLLAVIVAAVPNPPRTLTTAAIVSGALVVLAIVGLYGLLHPPAWSVRLANRLSRALPVTLRRRIEQLLGRFRAGLMALRSLNLMLSAVLVSVLQWSLVVAAIWCSGLAVGESVTLIAATVTFVLLVLGLTLPNSPMQIGTTQLAFVVGLGTDGTGVAAAIAASLVYTAFLIIPVMLAGAALALRGYADIDGPRRIRNSPD